MRRAALGAIAGLGGLASACTYPVYRTEVVAPAEHARLASGGRRDDLVVTTASGREVRLGADTWVRVRRRDGTATGACRGRELRVGVAGIMCEKQTYAITDVIAIRAAGLGPKTLDELRGDATVERIGVDTVRIVNAVEWPHLLRSARDVASRNGEPDGLWTFEAPNGSRHTVAGDTLEEVIERGFEITEGVRWTDVDAVEVAAERPVATMAATTGVTVFQVSLGIVVAAVSAGRSIRWGEAGPAFAPAPAVPIPTVAAPAPLSPGDAAPPADVGGTEPLFDTARRWRADVDPSVSLQTGVDPRGLLEHRATAAIRGEEHWELGGGLRVLQTRSIRYEALFGGFGYFAGVFPLDVRRRFEIVLGFDLGGSHDIGLVGSLDAGLRIGLAGRSLFVGLYPVNPTLTVTALVDGSNLSVPTRAELLWLF